MFPLLFVGACLTSIASSQERPQGLGLDGISQADRERIIRHEYHNSPDLPDSVSFHNILVSVTGADEEDRAFAVGLVQHRMGLSLGDAEQLVDHMIATFASFNAEMSEMVERLACSKRHTGDQIYTVFESIDDVRNGLLTKHLAIMKSELSRDQTESFDAWLQMRKPHISHIEYRHKEAYEFYGANAETTLETICQ